MKFEAELEKAKQWTLGTLKNKTASDMQKAIRAEAGADLSPQLCVIDGQPEELSTPLGYAACVTCGAVKPWAGGIYSQGLDAGHFLQSRCNSILFDERGIWPQCKGCNRNGGNPEHYEIYMLHRFGPELIDTLRRAKHQERRKFDHPELVTMRREYRERWKLAVKQMEAG